MKKLNNYINENQINEWVFSNTKNIKLDDGYCEVNADPDIDYLIIYPSGKVEAFSEFGLKRRMKKIEDIIEKSQDPDEQQDFRLQNETYKDLLNIEKEYRWNVLRGLEDHTNGRNTFFYPLGIKFGWDI